MSDFDKEAEREKLREKYEQDQEEREVAEKMSELLLQGATMTNAHCSECGDPIFRYDGQEFCATCEKAVDRGTGEAEDEDGEAVDQDNIEVTAPDENARVQFGADGADGEADQPERADQAEQPQQADQPGQPSQPQPADQTGERPQANEQDSSRETQPEETVAHQHRQPTQQPRETAESQQQRRQPQQPAQPRTVPSVDPGSEADVSTARESLVRTLTRFSQQAEATEDPQRASEYLAAAREAAETLSALRQ
jgi:uncharacterized Zn finger protein (UPF0148 family)